MYPDWKEPFCYSNGTLPPAYITDETKAQSGMELWVFGMAGPRLGSVALLSHCSLKGHPETEGHSMG